jgi:ABC-type nitrate/sulfonate/bicarbonate transport system substrate-binding protein
MAAVLATASAAQADPAALRVGNSSAQAFSFIPLEAGIRKGIFKTDGIEIERIDLPGSAKLHQAVAAGAVDIALSGGPDLAYIAKGAPELGVAQMAGPPLFLGITVPYNSPIKTADDLKGKKISVSAGGGVTKWLILRLAQQKGWGPDGVVPVASGGDWASQIAVLTTGQVDAAVTAAALGFKLEETKQGRLLMTTGAIAPDFIQHVIFASNQIIHDNPDGVRRFLKAWFETIAWMRANRTESIAIARGVTGFDDNVESREFDLVMPMFSADGKFEAAGLKVIQESFVELGLLQTAPDMSKLYTEAFLPGAPR